jgi:Homeodomain-like domain
MRDDIASGEVWPDDDTFTPGTEPITRLAGTIPGVQRSSLVREDFYWDIDVEAGGITARVKLPVKLVQHGRNIRFPLMASLKRWNDTVKACEEMTEDAREDRRRAMLTASVNGISNADIAHKLGMSTSQVSRELKQAIAESGT